MTPFPLGRPARIAVLASGRGTNLEALMGAFPQGHPLGEVALVLSDNPEALALRRAEARGVEAVALPWRGRRAFEEEALALLEARGIDLVALAGFMRLLSPRFVDPWYGRLLNLHPSLLPDYPGLGVHRRVLEAGEAWTGTTVHFVDRGMDTGPILLQARVPVLPTDTPEALEARVLKREHRLYPKALRLVLLGYGFPPGERVRALVGEEAWARFQALPLRARPFHLLALGFLLWVGKARLAPEAFLGGGGPWAQGAFLFARLVAEEDPLLREELGGLPEEVRRAVEEALFRVESPL